MVEVGLRPSAYSTGPVVDEYAVADYITGAEKRLFGSFIHSGSRVLDLGVGGGRTSLTLAGPAAEYIGIDNEPAMVAVCRQHFPQYRFEVMDAADLLAFEDGYFDSVVFSFNGLGNLFPDARRRLCLAECYRVLRPGGSFIFSLHYARSLIFRPPKPVDWKRLTSFLRCLVQSARRFFNRITKTAFWRGKGYVETSTHGGMTLFLATPDRVREELEQAGFSLAEVVSEHYPRRNVPVWTRWYYYAAIKPE